VLRAENLQETGYVEEPRVEGLDHHCEHVIVRVICRVQPGEPVEPADVLVIAQGSDRLDRGAARPGPPRGVAGLLAEGWLCASVVTPDVGQL
jgi:hypothetical protein